MFPNSNGPFADDSDPNAPQYASFPEGPVDVAGIFDYQTVEEGSGLPHFKLVGDRPVARLHLRLITGEKGPIMSADAAQLTLLAMAFAGPEAIKLVEGPNRMTAEFLLLVKQVANCQTEGQIAQNKVPAKQVAYVNAKGWVSSVTGTKPPLNTMYQVKFMGLRNIDGSDIPAFQETKFDSAVLMNLQITADMWGHPCPFTGYIETARLNQAFDGVKELPEADGMKRFAPRLRLTETGARHVAATRLLALVDAFCPELAQHEWQVDPTKSKYGVNETLNPLPVINALAKAGNHTAVGEYAMTTKKNQYFALESLKPVPDNLQPTTTAPVAPAVADTQRSKLASFIDAQCAIEKNANAFVDRASSLALTPAGNEWCKAHLVEQWTALQLPASRKLADLSEEQAGQLLTALTTAAEASSGF